MLKSKSIRIDTMNQVAFSDKFLLIFDNLSGEAGTKKRTGCSACPLELALHKDYLSSQ